MLSQQESPVPSADGTLRLNPERDFNYFGVSNVMYCLKSGRSVHRLLLHFLCKFFYKELMDCNLVCLSRINVLFV